MPDFLRTPQGRELAYVRNEGRAPGGVFLGGFKSDMTGTKALALEAHAKKIGRSFLRFDYSGHGQSSGAFADGAIGDWGEDALAALDHLTEGPQILIGSSMGGWLALLAALKRPQRVKGLVLIAPAPDFTQWGMWDQFDYDQRAELEAKGRLALPSDYSGDPYIITKRLIEDGRHHLLLAGSIGLDIPVRIIHGDADADVPWRIGLQILERLTSQDAELCLVKGGDHRLSSDADIDRLTATWDSLARLLP